MYLKRELGVDVAAVAASDVAGLGVSATARLPVATIGIFGDVGSSGGNEPRGW